VLWTLLAKQDDEALADWTASQRALYAAGLRRGAAMLQVAKRSDHAGTYL